jgi:hypothetical protein
MKNSFIAGTILALLCPVLAGRAEVKVIHERLGDALATPTFTFKTIPRPTTNDAAATAKFTLVDGRRDRNGAEVTALNDGLLPDTEDAPQRCFFFSAGTDGGRLAVDLGKAIEISQVNTYSWHNADRGPQVYQLFASDGQAAGFNAKPMTGTDPVTCGWQLVAKVDTRPTQGEPGGQYGVSVTNTTGSLGKFQHLLFVISRTEDRDAFGNTFFAEIDVVDRDAPPPGAVQILAPQTIREVVEIAGGRYKAVIDTSDAPDLTEWARKEIVPMVKEWYPKLVELLPSEGYTAPAQFTIFFNKDMGGVADTSGTRIRCAAKWFRANLKGESKGALFHEMVHVVQQYGRAPRREGATRPPTWLTEGITDYIRFFLFEPQTKGAEISARNVERARYDASYRITGNFLNYVSGQHGTNFVPRLNTVIREGRYNEEQWKTLTGKTATELSEAWKTDLQKKTAPAGTQKP